MASPTPADFLAALARHPRHDPEALPGRRNHLDSGVLLPLVWRPTSAGKLEPECIVTVRSAALRRHPGEVCFPGGRPDPGDSCLRETALREAREELGIEHAEVLGELSSMPLYTSDYRLHPFVAAVDDAPFLVNTAEVAEVLSVPLRREIERGEIDAIAWSLEDQHGLSPIFRIGAHVMYGATAHTFYELLCLAAGLYDLPPPALRPAQIGWHDVLIT
jgi:8-oxo-dGTP pyrophosphatase MutT (NUDIX family)